MSFLSIFSQVQSWEKIPNSFTEMMYKIIDENPDESKSNLIKLGADVWQKISSINNQIVLKLDCKNYTKVWICDVSDHILNIIHKENDIIKKKEKKKFLEKEKCKCFLEKQIIIKKKKGFQKY